MKLSCSLAVEALMAVLLVTQAAAAPMAGAHHVRGLEHQNEKRTPPNPKSIYDTGVGGKPGRKPPTVTLPKQKPPKGVSTKPKPAPKPVVKPTKPHGKREVVNEDAAAVEKRSIKPKPKSVYDTGVGGKPGPKPSTVTLPKQKPPKGVSTKPKPAPKPVVKPTKPHGKREVVNEDAAAVEKRSTKPKPKSVYDTGVGGKPGPKPSTVTIPGGKHKPKGVSAQPKPAPKPVPKSGR